MSRTVSLQIYFDLTAPWCYIAKRRVETAIAKLGEEVTVDVEWLPFERSPSLSNLGVNRRSYLTSRLGSWEKAIQLDTLVAELGKDDGLAFHFDRIERVPNTRDALQLVGLARREGLQDEVVEAFFRAYFTEGRDLSNRDVILDVVAGVGLERSLSSYWLDSVEGTAKLDSELAESFGHGIRHCPFIVIDHEEKLPWVCGTDTLASKLRRPDAKVVSLSSSDARGRQRYGFSRTSCDCDFCRVYCRHIPGRLDVNDLEQLCPEGTDVFAWAEFHLQAVTDTPVSRLVPVRQENGHCHWFLNGHCSVHEKAPYGCAFFDAHMASEQVKLRSAAANLASARDDTVDGLYSRVWRHLVVKSLTRRSGDTNAIDAEMRLIRASMELD